MAEKALTVDEVAERLRVGHRTIRLWLGIGKIPGVKVGKRWIVAETTVDAIIRGEIQVSLDDNTEGDE